MSLRKILETVIGFFSSSFKRKYVHTFVHTVACTVVVLGPTGFAFNAYAGRKYCFSSFQLFQQKRWSRSRFNCISMIACKGPVCVAVLTSFYGRFFVEVGQFINSKSFHLDRHFFHLLPPPRFGTLNVKASLPEVNKFTGNCFRVVRIVLKITFLKLTYPGQRP